ncbi:MAG TPA: hypothetical protein VGL77_01145, partial [Armatimonadota bacterium]
MLKNDYCLIPDRGQLAAKLSRAEGDLHFFWEWMTNCAKNAPQQYPWYQPFCAVVTGEAHYAEAARRTLVDFATRLPARDATIYVQYHHWAAAAPIARYGLYYDWVADLAAFTEDEHALIRGALLNYGVKHVLPSLQTKHHSDENNQVLALALAATMIGWVYGKRRGPSRAAEALLEYGVQRLTRLMDFLPLGGYSGEGSSYMQQIFAPGLVFSAKLLQEITGQDWFHRPGAKTGVTVTDVIRMAVRNITPGGLLLPWDHHGFSAAQNYMLLSTLAAETGEACWLHVPRMLHTWGIEQNMQWGYDDKVWALLSWPESTTPGAHEFHPWLEPSVAGAVVSHDAAVQVVQAWDVCADTGLGATRMHVNPNTLLIEAFGSPLTVDGSPTADCAAILIPGCRQSVNYFGPPCVADWSSGMPGAHSCLLVDGEEAFIPHESVHGVGVCHADLPGLQVVSADVSAFYAQHDAERVLRSTFLIDDRLILVTDLAEFTAPHALTWRIYLRPGVTQDERRFTLHTAEGVRAQLYPVDNATARHTPIEGFPNTLEKRSTRVDLRYAAREEHRLATVIMPEDGRDYLARWEDGWHFRPDVDNEGIAAGWCSQRTPWLDTPCLPASEPWPAFGGDPTATIGWYARPVQIATTEAEPLVLHTHRRLDSDYRVWWDGEELSLEGVPLLGQIARLPENARQPGEHWLVIRAMHEGMSFHEEDCLTRVQRPTFWGVPALFRAKTAEAVPAVVRRADGWLDCAEYGLILHDNHVGAHQSYANWRTDARHARLLGPEHWVVVDASFLQIGE